MKNDYIVKKVFRKYVSISAIIGIFPTIGMLVDGVMIGNYLGAKAMAAFGIVSPLFILFAALSGILGNGSISLSGRYSGKDQPERVNGVFTGVLICSGVVTSLCAAACIMFPEFIAYVFGARNELVALTSDYIMGLGLGAIPIIVTQVVMPFTKTDGSPELGLISILAMIIVNITLDLLNVYFFKMGMLGMALATSISYFVALLVCCTHFFKRRNTLRIMPLTGSVKEIPQIFIVGFPNGLNRICVTARTAFINYIFVRLASPQSLAAYSIQGSSSSLLSTACFGVSTVTLLLSGIFYGEEDKVTLSKLIKTSLKTGCLLSIVIVVAAIGFLRPIAMTFGKADMQVIDLAVKAIFFSLCSLPFYTINMVFLNYYQGTGNIAMANLICVGQGFACPVLVAGILFSFMGTDGVWPFLLFGEIVTLVTLTVVVSFRNKHFIRSLDDYLLLPKTFGVPEQMQLSLSIENDMKQVMELSESITDFCTVHGVDTTRAKQLSLCIEEMAGNVVLYAFKDQKKHFIDIRILIKGSDVIFRLRDDGIPFNPLKDLQRQVDDPEKNIGIKIVKGISKSTDYRNTVDLNNLIVKI